MLAPAVSLCAHKVGVSVPFPNHLVETLSRKYDMEIPKTGNNWPFLNTITELEF